VAINSGTTIFRKAGRISQTVMLRKVLVSSFP
jgi:hypothetical protein